MTENPLGYEKISKLLKNFAVPSIVASLVGSIYNIVDQIFIGQGVGYLGNAATNVAYPFSTICLAIALLVGIGSASRVSLCLGCKEPKAAAKAAGNGIVLMGIFGIIYLLVGETFLSLLLKAFGATTDVFPYAKQYASITLIGMPFLIVTNGMSNLIRADGKPKYSMVCMVVGAIIRSPASQSCRSWQSGWHPRAFSTATISAHRSPGQAYPLCRQFPAGSCRASRRWR